MTVSITKPRVAVIGGSLGGLATAIALRAAGGDVQVYERSKAALASRGGGIVVQPELSDFFSRYDPNGAGPAHTTCAWRRYFQADSAAPREVPMVQSFTSWDAIYRQLNSLWPAKRYHAGHEMVTLRSDPAEAVVEFANGSVTRVDLVVCADGSDSSGRQLLFSQLEPAYAGYVAWRGYLPEPTLDSASASALDNAFSFCQLSDGHFLCYPIPGDSGTATGPAAPATKRLNWVWYVDLPEGPALTDHLTDRDGQKRRASVPSGRVRSELIRSLLAKAEADLPPPMTALVRSTPGPFLQAIWDVAVPTGVVGRTVLLGDAAYVVRPHTAAATAKAFAEAMDLAASLESLPVIDHALEEFAARQRHRGQTLLSYGVGLGDRVGRGTPPQSSPRKEPEP